MKVILQTNQSDCLLACAAMIMETYGCKVPVYKLVEKVELSMAGSTVLQLKETLEDFGFTVDGYRLDKEKLSQTKLPLIAYVNNGHFIVINRVRKNSIIGIDPAIGRIAYSNDEFGKMYSGIVIKIQKSNLSSIQIKTHQTDILSLLKNKKIIRILIGLFITSVFTQIVAMSYSYMYSVVGEGGSYFELIILILLAVLFLGVGSVLQGILTKKFNILYEQIFGNNLIDKLMDKNYKFFSFRSNGDLLYRINARGSIKDALLLKLVPSFIALCTIVFVQVLLFAQSLFLGTIFLLAVVLYLVAYIGICRIVYMESNKYTQKVIQLNTTSENIIRGISTIKVLGVEKIFMDKWHKENQTQAECYGQLVIMQSIQSVITNIFTYIVPIAVSIISIISSENKNIFIQIALLPLLYLVVQNVVIIGQACNSIYTVLPNIDKTTELIDDEFMRDNERHLKNLSSNKEIQVKNMFYHYGSFKCLNNVNITIEKGKKYAVVGVSGSGKSTLLKILANLLNDYQGEVAFNLNSTQKPIYLDQDTTIMDGTILENVLLGQKCTNDRLLAISNATGVDEVVKMQPHNWGTEISKGKNLSRGQEQRICLARCLVKNANVYLLDEATSNIDVIDEERIMKALLGKGGLLEKKTVLISTHKLNMINYVDEVIYIKDRKVYQGTHEQLLESIYSYNAFINGKAE
ncbi:ATP-binding cassette domain-containing protein [Mediterraneibacter glycyrrhizinilyticus]|uniref:peptidase domain-containing ABC transporter n=1 Tax=Mediterraneibacter glycyrrhizinilyticus TaxID=342942 RepID=UPI0019604CE2|nr:cysteine peptidase family C39 domain-containing protein [Mediterraneibacter glycyrrhizinilyticus]MBM6750066.1 ATP-binding cassette domain-containing protein [Mediterraneibacter glycyrrhizinilyticus]